MSIALSHDGGCCRMELDGAIDISCAADLKASLLQALETGEEISISLTGTTELDVTAVQLLWAAGARSRAAEPRIQVTQPPELCRLLADAGLELPANSPSRRALRSHRRGERAFACQLNVGKTIQGRKGRARI